MKKLTLYLVSLISLTLLVSCSTLPKETVSPLLQEAEHFYRLGKQMEAERELENALHLYRLANENYTLIDNKEGVILSRIAIIGSEARIDPHQSFSEALHELDYYVRNTIPRFIPHLLLLKTEISHLKFDYEQVVRLTEDFRKSEPLIDSQIIAYRLMALLKLNEPADREYSELQKLLRPLGKNYRKKRTDDGGVYSYTNFVLGFYQMKNEQWESAEAYYKESLEVDKTSGYSYGIAQNLFSLGKLYHAQEKYEMAKIHYLRALPIYELLEEQDAIDDIICRLNNLYPRSPGR
jgi:tetratricopeptide (TPR) repeat protein